MHNVSHNSMNRFLMKMYGTTLSQLYLDICGKALYKAFCDLNAELKFNLSHHLI